MEAGVLKYTLNLNKQQQVISLIIEWHRYFTYSLFEIKKMFS